MNLRIEKFPLIISANIFVLHVSIQVSEQSDDNIYVEKNKTNKEKI